METLLKPGDMIRIRDDIDEHIEYKMILSNNNKNSWVPSMAKPGALVTIQNISQNGQYITDHSHDRDFDIDGFWLYTDEMFDPLMLCLLIEERLNL